MPVILGKDKDGCYAKWGPEGAKYHYECNNESARTNAKDKALTQGRAIESSKFKTLKVSFDYDDTLSTEKGQRMAKNELKNGNEVYIITRRQDTALGPVYELAKELGIKRENVHATNGKLKWETVDRLGIDIHYDNNQNEIDKINKNTIAKGRLFK